MTNRRVCFVTQSQTAVAAYLKSERLLLFALARQCGFVGDKGEEGAAYRQHLVPRNGPIYPHQRAVYPWFFHLDERRAALQRIINIIKHTMLIIPAGMRANA